MALPDMISLGPAVPGQLPSRMPFPPSDSGLLERIAAGAVAATAIAFVARRHGSLSTSGAGATVFVGIAATAAGWNWGVLLVAYFVAATGLSRLGRARKERVTRGVVAKGGARDATQVLANGGMFAAGVLLAGIMPGRIGASMGIAALGALAASAADTWATEIGTLYGGTPRYLLGFRRVTPGTSGGVSAIGSLAMVAGATFVATAARWLGLPGSVFIILVAGVAGALADSVLGATLQERRWCPDCERASERHVHDCGASTTLTCGLEWMDNDTVNLIATIAGAAVAVLLANV